MKPINNWENISPYGYDKAERLPAGGYVARILGAKEATYIGKDGFEIRKLEICVDVSEGEYTGFYKKQYDESTFKDKKMKGVYRCDIPKGDGSDRDIWSQRKLKTAITAIEESNSGYRWGWDENTLKGLTVGILVRDAQYDIDGKTGWYSEIFALFPAEKIREGKFDPPAPKPLKKTTANTVAAGVAGVGGIGYPPPPPENPVQAADVDNAEGDYPF